MSYLLHFFTAALYSLVGVYASRDGGQLLLLLTLSHLRLHAVDEAFDCSHLEEEQKEQKYTQTKQNRCIQYEFRAFIK